MPLKFHARRHQSSFLDPFRNFAPSRVEVELRIDPLSGDRSRILSFRYRDLGRVDHSLFLERDRQRPCPFCPENLPRMAGRFLPELVPEGHLHRGQAVCFPNVFPYEGLSAVVVMTRQHYLRPSQIKAEQLSDAFLLAAESFRRLGRGLRFGSVNWNYMMPAGAGLVHPHVQTAGSTAPTRYQARLRARARAFARRESRDIVEAYLEHEQSQGARWLGRLGPAYWLAPFAPRAIYDLMALVPGGRGLLELTPRQVQGLARGVARVLRFFESAGVGAFNLSLHTALTPDAGLPLMLRMVSRVHIPPMGVDEINYFEKLHEETVCFLSPEEVAKAVRPFWSDKKP
ncbi:MAG: hypothetical protein C4525_11175 [Desulfarculus sp.]|nr:MAG: hypothetical protein C4525_11175 [Desulfarculus sp.]